MFKFKNYSHLKEEKNKNKIETKKTKLNEKRKR
jgi:hypothetical protein